MAEKDRIEVAVIDRTVYLKAFGFAVQANCLGAPDLIHAMFQAGCRSVVFDLAECKGMDSTFLGVMADAASSAPQRLGKNVIIINASEDLVRLLRRTGLLPLVCVHEGKVVQSASLKLRQIDSVHFPRTERQQLHRIKDLHQTLAKLNEKNLQTFGPFICMLEEELQQGPFEEDDDR